MFISEALVSMSGRIVLDTREVTGFRDVLSEALGELCCHHGPGDDGFCLMDPPAWTWRIGIGSRFRLGAALQDLGIRGAGPRGRLVQQREIDPAEAVQVWGWDEAHLSWMLAGIERITA